MFDGISILLLIILIMKSISVINSI